MIWPLTLSRTILLKKTVDAPKESVLRHFHDPNVLLSANPLATDIVPDDAADPSNVWYTVTDRIIIARFFKTKTTFRCRLFLHEDGVTTEAQASLWTRLKGEYKIAAGKDGTTEIIEKTTVQCLFFMLPFVISTMTNAHRTVLETVAIRAEQPSSRREEHKPAVNIEQSNFIFYIIFIFIAILATLFNKFYFTTVLVLLIGILLASYEFKPQNDPYGLFHLGLNKLPGEDASEPPKTEWVNMGYWKDTTVFPQACAARKLALAAQCQQGDKVLDVGHGTGDSVLLLLSDPSVPRPSSVTGITTLPSHHVRSRRRVDKLLSSLVPPKPEAFLHIGDAIHRGLLPDHPLDPHTQHRYDRILALDCAYHFDTRQLFLQQAFEKLSPGGRIALADICFDLRGRYTLSLFSYFFQLLPASNVVTANEYIAQMEAIGYTDVQLEDISQYVFPGFARFLKSRGFGWSVFGLIITAFARGGARFVIISGRSQS